MKVTDAHVPDGQRLKFQLLNKARRDPTLPDHAFRVLSCLAEYCYGDSVVCYPSVPTIAIGIGARDPGDDEDPKRKERGMRGVRASLRRLQARGYVGLMVETKGGRSTGRYYNTNLYRLHVEAAEEPSPPDDDLTRNENTRLDDLTRNGATISPECSDSYRGTELQPTRNENTPKSRNRNPNGITGRDCGTHARARDALPEGALRALPQQQPTIEDELNRFQGLLSKGRLNAREYAAWHRFLEHTRETALDESYTRACQLLAEVRWPASVAR